MNEPRNRRPLQKKSDVPQPQKNLKIMGSKGVGEIPAEVTNMLQQFQSQQNFVPPEQPVSEDGVTQSKKPRIRSVEISEIPREQEFVPEHRNSSNQIPEEAPPFNPMEVFNPLNQPVMQNVQQAQQQPVNNPVETVNMATREKEVVTTTQKKSIPINYQHSQSHRVFRVPLPSKGLLYGGAYAKGYIEVRPMTTKEESILYTPGEWLGHINKVLNSCVVNHEIDPMELTLGDRFALLLYIRTFSYGSKYEVPFRCSACGKQYKLDVDLATDLSIEHMPDDLVEPIEYDFPMSDNYIHFRLLRGKDEVEIAKRTKKMILKTVDEGDPSSNYRLAASIVGINGVEVDINEAMSFVENLLPGDAHDFRQYQEEIEGKIDTTIYHECQYCGVTNDFEMPFTTEFFRPTRKRHRGTV